MSQLDVITFPFQIIIFFIVFFSVYIFVNESIGVLVNFSINSKIFYVSKLIGGFNISYPLKDKKLKLDWLRLNSVLNDVYKKNK
jgi:hypothetical protein